MLGPCAKQVVSATIIARNGARFFGTNACRNPQEACPRGDMPSGVGYELCHTVCDQVGHAETVAIAAAGEQARGSKLYLEGHTYACQDCRSACFAAGVADIIVQAPPAA